MPRFQFPSISGRSQPSAADLSRALQTVGRPQLPANITRQSLQAAAQPQIDPRAMAAIQSRQRDDDRVMRAIQALERRMDRLAGPGAGGQVQLSGPSYRRALVQHVNSGRSKGGVLSTSEVTIPAGTVADTGFELPLTGTDLSRAVDTYIHAISVVGSGEFLDDAVSRRIVLTMRSAGVAVEPLIRIPCDILTPTSVGEESIFALREPYPVPANPDITFALLVTSDLGTAADSEAAVRLYCGGL